MYCLDRLVILYQDNIWARKVFMKDTGCATWQEARKKYTVGIDSDILNMSQILKKVKKSHLNNPMERPTQ